MESEGSQKTILSELKTKQNEQTNNKKPGGQTVNLGNCLQ